MARLSDIQGERSLDVIADIVEPIMNIASDDAAAELFGRKALPEGMEVREFVLARIRNALPALLRTHKDDVITICSTIKGVTSEEYKAELTPEKVIIDLADLMTDAVFNSFFNSAPSENT